MTTEINRRELLQRVAYLMGGVVSAPAVLGVLNGCTAKQDPSWQPVFLSKEQAALVGEVADLIIPRTDTPGAKDAGVPQFIDVMLKNVYEDDDRKYYIEGLQAFEEDARKAHGKAFVELPKQTQVELLRKFHDPAVAEELSFETRPTSYRRPFVLMTKELTLLGFFTSKPGATQVLQYEAVPGRFQACIPLAQAGNGKSWALEAGRRF
ncbi:MAG: gluconate 2-dehydrogenase subunit 3 family protein [Steroidobacter sp.]